jgi:glycosyltransferase involved in cell wall biosynthesis
MCKYKFTVYTPVYNSARYIERVYNSLKGQIYRNFEWLIINDGSNDNSSEIITQLKKKCDFKVHFIDIEQNIGFAPSLNLAVSKAEGEFFLIAHADDEFVAESLKILDDTWENLSEIQKKEIQGVKCNVIDQYGNLIGDRFPSSPWISDLFDITFNKKIKGEKWGSIRTEIMREFPFPEDDKFIPEALIWFRIYNKYKAVFINQELRVYYVDHNPGSLMADFNKSDKFLIGKRLFELDFINLYFKRMTSYPFTLTKFFILYWRYTFLLKFTVFKGLVDIKGFPQKIVATILLPLVYIYSRLKH